MTNKEPHPASPTVFISSTVKEFLDLRSAIAYTLRERGLTVHLSEAFDFGVRGDRSAFEECFENIHSCDYYILLIGYNRGTLYDKDDGISITRQEYRVARDQFLSSGRPRLLLYLREDAEKALLGGKQPRRKQESMMPNISLILLMKFSSRRPGTPPIFLPDFAILRT